MTEEERIFRGGCLPQRSRSWWRRSGEPTGSARSIMRRLRTIGHDCWFGANVVVCPGVTIGENCVIGAGSVVTRDIPAGSFAAGNPARVIRPITAADTVRGRFPGIRG